MRAEEFWDSTPYEIAIYLEAYGDRERRTMEILAWHAANVMAPHLKRPIKPQKLLPRKGVTLSAADFPDKESFLRAVEASRETE